MAEEPPPRRGSIIRRKRVGSVKARPSSVTSTGGCQRTQSEKCTYSSDVSILVTEASPEGANTKPALNRQNSESTVVQVLVHRESEEYSQDEEQERTRLLPAAEGNASCSRPNHRRTEPTTDVVVDLNSPENHDINS